MSLQDVLRWIGGVDVWARRALALGLIALLAVILSAIKSRLARRLTRFAAATPARLDDVLAEMATRTSRVFVLAVSVLLALFIVPLAPPVERLAKIAAMLLCLLQVGVWASIALRGLVERRFVAGSADPADAGRAGVARMAAFGGRVLIWSLLVLVALANLGVDVSALVAGLGVGGVAVALATQNILGDLFASFSILLDKPFVVGDFVVVGDFMGSIEQIGVKTTRVRSLGGEQIVFSNNDLLQSRLRNYKRMNERRIAFKFGVVYQTDPGMLRAIPGVIRQAITSQHDTRFDRAHFLAFGDSALQFEVVYYVLDADYNVYMDVQQAINLEIYEKFAQMGIEFAYQTQILMLRRNGAEAAQPDATGSRMT